MKNRTIDLIALFVFSLVALAGSTYYDALYVEKSNTTWIAAIYLIFVFVMSLVIVSAEED